LARAWRCRFGHLSIARHGHAKSSAAKRPEPRLPQHYGVKWLVISHSPSAFMWPPEVAEYERYAAKLLARSKLVPFGS
jgi:hypothetical protein